jgi:CheY-like chemotaxis protein
VRIAEVGDCETAGEAAARKTSASTRCAILLPGAELVSAGVNTGASGMGEASSSDLGVRGSADRQICVLVVEDDPALQRMILNYFAENNIRALVASGREEMVRQLAGSEVSLVILDLRLGQEDGLDLLREVRSSSDVPVIIITGHRRDDIDRVVGLELGADDYLTKPFNLRELLARVRAVLRRFDVPSAVVFAFPVGSSTAGRGGSPTPPVLRWS